MKYLLIAAAIVLFAGAVAALLYMRYFAKNTPSIMGGGYDQKFRDKAPE